jgi:hypothetical protein
MTAGFGNSHHRRPSSTVDRRLLENERRAGGNAPVADAPHPVELHRQPAPAAALGADDRPVQPPRARAMQNAPLREQHPATSGGSGVGVVRRWYQARGSAADATDAGRSSRAFGSGALSGPGKCARGGARYTATATSAARRRANERPPAVTLRARATRPHGTSPSRAANSELSTAAAEATLLITYSPGRARAP